MASADVSVTLAALREGERAQVIAVEDPSGHSINPLVEWGVLPGTDLTLVQRSPVFVFRIGHAEFAVDQHLAGRIRVRLTKDEKAVLR